MTQAEITGKKLNKGESNRRGTGRRAIKNRLCRYRCLRHLDAAPTCLYIFYYTRRLDNELESMEYFTYSFVFDVLELDSEEKHLLIMAAFENEFSLSLYDGKRTTVRYKKYVNIEKI